MLTAYLQPFYPEYKPGVAAEDRRHVERLTYGGLSRYNKAMSLTDEDLSQVRGVVVDAIQELILPRFDEHDKRFEAIEADLREVKEDVRSLKADMHEVKDRLGHLEGRVEALEADVKELYVIAKQHSTYADKNFRELSVEQKVLRMYEDVKLLAQEAGVTLPS